MKTALVTGSSGLVGSACARLLMSEGWDVFGLDNNMRMHFFGDDGDTRPTLDQLLIDIRFAHWDVDIRDTGGLDKLFANHRFEAIVHCAAQPSHDWAAKDPQTDFTVNANGTLNLLECARKYCPEAPFVFLSTNKVYGDHPNYFPMVETETRYNVMIRGFAEMLSVDTTKHSLFGASKLAADILTQEYGRYFHMPTTVFRPGCITGGNHAGAEAHGFLSYLVKCCKTGKPYKVYGYKGKQVRDNIHAEDLAHAIYQVIQKPRHGEVYNIGGEAKNSVSILEAIDQAERVTGKKLEWSYTEEARSGDHIWYVTDMTKFRNDYPNWKPNYTLPAIFEDLAQ